jgi:hypothetical protein
VDRTIDAFAATMIRLLDNQARPTPIATRARAGGSLREQLAERLIDAYESRLNIAVDARDSPARRPASAATFATSSTRGRRIRAPARAWTLAHAAIDTPIGDVQRLARRAARGGNSERWRRPFADAARRPLSPAYFPRRCERPARRRDL